MEVLHEETQTSPLGGVITNPQSFPPSRSVETFQGLIVGMSLGAALWGSGAILVLWIL